ncbi:hypothetical protein MNBD_ALPHA03-1672 [hydrothermal vent metagenome]|uniref:Uncharacterized protein n=1 Tax=hydrothermal vent metagenome TaxID=652676 RepID=A0A3B1B1T4_9ZZZZ
MRFSYKRSVLVIMILMAAVSVGHAHRFYAAFTQIDLQENTQVIEVVHRLFTHDVEDLLRSELGNSSGLSNAEITPILKAFIEKDFAIFDNQGNRLPLTWIAMEYNIDNVLIYQEAALPSKLAEITIINRLFMALFEDQRNTVNVEWKEKIRTRIFKKGMEQQNVNFNKRD